MNTTHPPKHIIVAPPYSVLANRYNGNILVSTPSPSPHNPTNPTNPLTPPFPLSKSSFSASSYAAFRPTYSQAFYTTLLRYHHGPTTLLLDLGTGHGTTARALSPSFTRILATDPSATMIAQARASSTAPQLRNVEFRQAAAEDLSAVPSGSVDAVVAAQAAHWFDYARAWPELARVVRRGGSLAFWGYKDNVFVEHPRATRILDRYCYALEGRMMGGFWEQPGRSILRDLYREIEPPVGEWEEVVRREYEPGTGGKGSGTGECVMGRRMKLGEVEGYMRTFSAFNNWAEANPGRKAKAEGGEGDVVDECLEEMVEAEPEWKAEGESWREKEVEVEWGSVMLMARRK